MKNMFNKIIFLILAQTALSIDPVVELPTGLILGREVLTSENKSFYAFEGIPYAAPPTGKLRFQAPQPPQKWDCVLNTTHSNVACHQFITHFFNESEDCLLLHVFTSKLPSGEDNDSLPVMLSIHGGGFVFGAGSIFPPDLFINNDVILVAINYRLGIFGFLSTQDEVIPGNAALKDQLQAIRWTNENIHLFGGDPERITVFGGSGGAASTAYQLLNQNSAGLFRAVILQSGTSINPWANRNNVRELGYTIASLLNFTGESSEELRDFLQNVEAGDLNSVAELYYLANQLEYDSLAVKSLVMWAPVLEVEHPGAFITEKMYQLLKNGTMLKVPTLIGMTSEESLSSNQDTNKIKQNLNFFDQHLDLLVPDDMQIDDLDERIEMGRKIREIYTGGEPFADHLGDGIRYSSDNAFTRASIKYAEMYSNLADTYFYQFSYDGPLGNTNFKYSGAENVSHGEESNYLFCGGSSCTDSIYPESDLLTRQRLIKLWTNFAKYLNPTPEESDLLQNITWPTVSTADGDFLYLDIDKNLEVKNHPKEETFTEWKKLYDSLGRDDFITY